MLIHKVSFLLVSVKQSITEKNEISCKKTIFLKYLREDLYKFHTVTHYIFRKKYLCYIENDTLQNLYHIPYQLETPILVLRVRGLIWDMIKILICIVVFIMYLNQEKVQVSLLYLKTSSFRRSNVL